MPGERCGSGQVPPGREGSGAAARGGCEARQSTSPVPQGFHTARPLPSAKYSHFCYFTCARSGTGQVVRTGVNKS